MREIEIERDRDRETERETERQREIPMQYYTSTKVLADKHMENHVCNDCTYRQNSLSEVLSDVK